MSLVHGFKTLFFAGSYLLLEQPGSSSRVVEVIKCLVNSDYGHPYFVVCAFFPFMMCTYWVMMSPLSSWVPLVEGGSTFNKSDPTHAIPYSSLCLWFLVRLLKPSLWPSLILFFLCFNLFFLQIFHLYSLPSMVLPMYSFSIVPTNVVDIFFFTCTSYWLWLGRVKISKA